MNSRQRRSVLRLCFLLFATILSGVLAPLSAQGGVIGFDEKFALASDREKVLESLIPGTEDYYYYQCRHRQDIGDFKAVGGFLGPWIGRHGRTSRVIEIENRQALLNFAADPKATYRFLQQRLGLKFDHQRQVAGEKPDLPTSLDQALISRRVLASAALSAYPRSIRGFGEPAYDFLVASNLRGDLLMSLLKSLKRPDYANLPALIVRNLGHKQSRGFGSLEIHKRLVLAQLEDCLRLKPDLLNSALFIDVYLRRLHPAEGVQWERDDSARESYLQRLQSFADRIGPAHNSLKAHVLYHRLVHDQALGKPDLNRFLAYLRLPRSAHYVNPKYQRNRKRGEAVVSIGARFATGLPPIRRDEALIRSYLAEFFGDMDGFAAFSDYLRAEYLQRLFAETKILAGVGDRERWYSMLADPSYYEQLEQRVEIAFPPTQRRSYGATERVVIEVDVKNVKNLLCKVFEINTLNYFRETGKAVDASIALDGLVANQETTHAYSEPALRRVRRRFELASLDKAGVYVVEFIGNGISSRAVIKKGRLQFVERSGVAGQVFRVFNETGEHLKDASIWFGGKNYPAASSGELTIPYSTAAGSKKILLQHGGLTTQQRFSHRRENYGLAAGVYVDRESLLAGRRAKILVRPSFTLDGRQVDIGLLEDVVLRVNARDHDGVASSQDVASFKLFGDRESVHEITVPVGLAVLEVSLHGKIRSLSEGKDVVLQSSVQKFVVNGIHRTAETGCALLGKSDAGYFLDVLGRNGEPKVDHAVSLRLTHRQFRDRVTVELKTDAAGRIHLGALDGISSVQPVRFPLRNSAWGLRDQVRTYPRRIHALEGEVVHLAYQGSADALSRQDLSVLEVRNGVFVRDVFGSASLKDGFVELRGLKPGDYDLLLEKEGQQISVRVAAGVRLGAWVIGDDRLLETSSVAPLHIQSCEVVGEELRIVLANAGKQARVQVIASRYVAPFRPFLRLGLDAHEDLRVQDVDHPESIFFAGRELGDEYRYILDRRYAAKYSGNMLRRPGLLLNPWALETVSDSIGLGGGSGGKFGGRGGGRSNRRKSAGSTGQSSDGGPGTFPKLEFLGAGSVVLTNLRAGADGTLVVPLARLGEGQQIHVVAIDSVDTVYKSITRVEQKLAPKSQSLSRGMDTTKHFTEQRKIEFLDKGASAVFENSASAAAKTYDSLASVYQLYRAMSADPDLAKFAFILDWPSLDQDTKLDLYSKHACHELNFFIHQKDPEFFAAVVKPFLQNLSHKTFIDDWLLEDDLSTYLEPRAFARLNIVERVLLARGLSDQSSAIGRHVRELNDLIVPNPERQSRLFRSALKSGALESQSNFESKLGLLSEAAPAPRKSGADKKSKSRRRNKNLERGRDKAPMEKAKEELEMVEAEEPEPSLDEDSAFDSNAWNSAIGLGGLKDARKKRGEVRSLYRAPEPTRRYVEHRYWHRRLSEQNASMITVNAFWRDYALATDAKPFFSLNLTEATRSFAEMMMALAVLDLPFKASVHETKVGDSQLTLKASSPLLLVRKQIEETLLAAGESPILVSQNFYRLDDRYRYVANERRDAYIRDEFLRDVAYGCQVVVTNPSSTPRKLELLLQIPEGSISVKSGFDTRGVSIHLGPYKTQSIEYAFYFPATGTFSHYPVHVSSGASLVAFVEPLSFEVVAEASKVDTTSWQYVSQNGSAAEVSQYLDGANLFRTDLTKIAWRMRDASYFAATIDRLRSRHSFDVTLWAYGIRHADEVATREYLRHIDGFLDRCGRYLNSPLVSIDPVERLSYQHIEYEPLFNARAHKIGKQRMVANVDLARQYRRFLSVLAYHPRLDAADWMTVTYYLLLQDRIEEALSSFAKVDAKRLPMQIQYDYMRAYLDFFSDEHLLARGIAERYADYPVIHWRSKFADIINQLDEADGKATGVSDLDSRTQSQNALASTEPSLELNVESRRVQLRMRNLDACEVNYYEMDVETLFSSQPFAEQGSGSFAFIRPNKTEMRSIDKGVTESDFDLPKEFHNANVLVEVRAAGLVKRKAYYANSLSVQIAEGYGQLRVTHQESNKSLAKVYVKVFKRLQNGRVEFHKDGYTDLRGRFDYASLSGGKGGAAKRYAIMVLSEEHGAVIREIASPRR